LACCARSPCHRDDVVSKAEILEGVWDTNHDGNDNVAEV
jgi:DNA-binding response OmpR family regulator